MKRAEQTAGNHIAAETATLDIRVRADEPSDEQFTFSVREAGFLVTH